MGKQSHISSLLQEKIITEIQTPGRFTDQYSFQGTSPACLGKYCPTRNNLGWAESGWHFEPEQFTLLDFHFFSHLNPSWEQPSSASYSVSERCPRRNPWSIFKYPKQRDTMFYIHFKSSFLGQSTALDAGKVNKTPLLAVSNDDAPLQALFQWAFLGFRFVVLGASKWRKYLWLHF